MKLGIGLRLTIWWVMLFAAGVVLFSVLAAAWVEHTQERSLTTELLTQAQESVAAVDPVHNRFTRAIPLPAIAGYALVSYVNRRPGEVRGAPPSAAALARAAHLPAGRTSFVRGNPSYLVAVAAAGPRDRGPRAAAFADNDALEDEEERVRAALLVAGVPMLLFAGFIGWLPARAVDQMLARLKASFERERAFIGDVSHELRQPLAAIGAEAELTLLRERRPAEYARAIGTIHERAEHLSRTIDDLLLLARADAGVVGRVQRGEVNEAVSGACAALQRRESGTPVELTLSEEPMSVAVGTTLLTRMMENLIANARRAARSGVRVEVSCAPPAARITVDDDGPGVPSAEREAIFRRFYRGHSGGDGTGLGLAIAAAIAHAGGGEIRVEERPGGGARFVVTLPTMH